MKFKAGTTKFKKDFTVCELGGVDLVLGNIFLHYYGLEIRQRHNLQVVMVDMDGKPKPLPFIRVAELDRLRINLVSKQNLFEEQFILILKEDFLPPKTKGEILPLSLTSLVMSQLMNYLTSYLSNGR